MLSTVKRISVIICISTFFCFFIICCSEPNDNTKHISESLNTNKEQINRSKMKAPIFTPDVSTDTRNIITAFLTAYNCYDGKTAYKYLKTSREEFSIINAYTSVRIPIINIKVSTDDIETLKLEYEMPHPGDILAAILRGGDDIDSNKKNIDTRAAPS